MAKAEWGAKHGCPKCGTRFYDLGKDDPVTCVECGHTWIVDPVLKSKQPIPYEEVKKDAAKRFAGLKTQKFASDDEKKGDKIKKSPKKSKGVKFDTMIVKRNPELSLESLHEEI